MAKRYNESRKMMAEASGMIREDRSAPCLLPREVIDKQWPSSADYNMGYVDDLFNGVQKQMSEDRGDFGKAMGPKKY